MPQYLVAAYLLNDFDPALIAEATNGTNQRLPALKRKT